MEIILVHKANFYNRPPVISALLNLIYLGHNVTLITEGINEYWQKELNEKGVKIVVIKRAYTSQNFAAKFLNYYVFRKKVASVLKETKCDFLWVEGAYTMVALGNLIKTKRYILQIQELHQNSVIQLSTIKKLVKDAHTVFMPEYNRTILYQCWFNLSRRPIVLPNKPYFLPTKECLLIYEQKHSALVNLFNTHKVILYQGHIGPDRDLSAFICAVDELADDFIVVLMGKDYNMVEKYKKISKKIYHIEYIPAPEYLLFTSKSYIGILGYNPNSLNNSFCAPNKIFEYSAYAKPMLGNDIPGLKCIEESGAGEIIDENNSDSIINAIKKIDKNYEIYSNKSRNFFEKVDNVETIRKALQQ